MTVGSPLKEGGRMTLDTPLNAGGRMYLDSPLIQEEGPAEETVFSPLYFAVRRESRAFIRYPPNNSVLPVISHRIRETGITPAASSSSMNRRRLKSLPNCFARSPSSCSIWIFPMT